MRLIIYHTIIFFSGLLLTTSAPDAASIYLWTDDDSRMHITEKPPTEKRMVRDVFEYQPGAAHQATEPSSPSEAASSDIGDNEARCRNVSEARRTLRKAKSVAVAVRNRAEDAREKVEDLRQRIGFDDDRRDDFKDDLKRLERDARQAEMFSEQAELDVKIAALQVKLAEYEAGEPCADKREY